MKSTLTILLSFVALNFITAQTSGVINYSEIVKMNFSMDGDQSAGIDLSEFLPESMTSSFDLYFNNKKSTYKKASTNENDMEIEDEEGGIRIVVMTGDIESELYIDQSTNLMTELKGFMGKAFIVEEELEKLKWKITSEKVIYLDYECIKATRTNEDGKEVIAWFAPKIPTSIGPKAYGQLPGAILMLSEGEEDIVIKATEIQLKEVSDIEKPTGGEKVTFEEYEKIVEEKTKEMIQQNGGTGFQIRN